MDNHIDFPPREFGFDVAGQKPLRFLLLPQECIEVGQAEAAYPQMGLFP